MTIPKISIRSAKAFQEAKLVIPGGVNSPVRSFSSVGGVPPFIERGMGSTIVDIDGNKYLDMCGSWGALILGHAHPHVVSEAKKAMEKGSSFGAPTLLETQLARLMINAVPSLEQVRLVSSGTEAVMSALRVARAYTGRRKIIKFDGCYHGHADSLLINAGSGLATQNIASSDGVPTSFTEHTISLPYNNEEAVEKAFSQYGKDIAAIIVEGVPANMGVVLPREGFLKFLREISRKHSSLLIMDEVITGFRLGLGGAQGLFDIEPDLSCYGKIIGGGLPVGAYGGTKKIMSHLAPLGTTYQAGTLSGNPVAVSAGIATLEILMQPDFYKALNEKSELFIQNLKVVVKGKLRINAIGSMFTMFFTTGRVDTYDDAKRSDTKAFAKYYHTMLGHGFYYSPAQFEANFISSAHSTDDLAAFASAMAKSIDH